MGRSSRTSEETLTDNYALQGVSFLLDREVLNFGKLQVGFDEQKAWNV